DDVEECRFAGAVRAEDAVKPAFGYAQIDAKRRSPRTRRRHRAIRGGLCRPSERVADSMAGTVVPAIGIGAGSGRSLASRSRMGQWTPSGASRMIAMIATP